MPDLKVVSDVEAKPKGRWMKWEGGRFWAAPDGTRTYYIRRRMSGKRIEVRTTATTEKAAYEHLKRFEADSTAYDPVGTVKGEPVYLDKVLANDFLDYSVAPKNKGGAGNTARWVGEQRRYLAWWGDALAGVNLRNRSLLRAKMDAALKDCTGYPQRLAVLKKLCSWLRKKKNRLTFAEDATLDVAIPQADKSEGDPERAVPKKEVLAAMKKLPARWRDLLTVLAGTGMHVSELERFAQKGKTKKLPRNGKAEGAAGVVVIPSTKDGDPLNVAVSKTVLDAAVRVLAAGSFDRQKLGLAVHAACDAAGVERFGPGQMRHSVATWAIDKGDDPKEVSSFLNHKSPRTTQKFYARFATPKKVKTLI